MSTYKNGVPNYQSPRTTFQNAGGTLCNKAGEIRPYLRKHPAQAAAAILGIMQTNRAFDKAAQAYRNATS